VWYVPCYELAGYAVVVVVDAVRLLERLQHSQAQVDWLLDDFAALQ
jgi:hypothetical protein